MTISYLIIINLTHPYHSVNFVDVLHAWRKSKDPDAPERCEALLTEMYELGSANSNLPHCKPDTFAVTVGSFVQYLYMIQKCKNLTSYCWVANAGLASLLGRIES